MLKGTTGIIYGNFSQQKQKILHWKACISEFEHMQLEVWLTHQTFSMLYDIGHLITQLSVDHELGVADLHETAKLWD